MKDVADTIRDIEGSNDLINPQDFSDRIKKLVGKEVEPSGPSVDPNCVILYTTPSGNISTELNDYDVCNANFISNTYENGQGVLLYDAPITSIKESAFDDTTCDLSTVVLPATVTEIGQYFGYGGSIEEIYIKSITPPVWNDTNICEQGHFGVVYVPEESIDTYHSTTPFRAYKSRVVGYKFE